MSNFSYWRVHYPLKKMEKNGKKKRKKLLAKNTNWTHFVVHKEIDLNCISNAGLNFMIFMKSRNSKYNNFKQNCVFYIKIITTTMCSTFMLSIFNRYSQNLLLILSSIKDRLKIWLYHIKWTFDINDIRTLYAIIV